MTQVSFRQVNPMPCALCLSIAAPAERCDQPLFESRNFVAVPSLGSLVEGWLLLLPRRHFISMGVLTPDLLDEFRAFKLSVAAHLRSAYGDICAFEHGPCAPGRPVGCGVDHAHVHMVPLRFNLVEAAIAHSPDVSWQPASWSDCVVASERQSDYLFVEQPLGVGMMAVAPQFGSQVLRKVIACRIGRPDEFNWRTHRQDSNIEKTIGRLSSVPVSA